MSQTTVVKVKVEELSKYGFKANGRYVNYSKQITEADKARVVPGAEFEAEYFVSDSGKEYLNKIVARSPKVDAPKVETPKAATEAKPNVDSDRAKRFTPKFNKEKAPDNSMSKEDWNRKDERISRQGLIQASFIALAPVVSLETLFDEAVKLADKGLEYVNRNTPKSA